MTTPGGQIFWVEIAFKNYLLRRPPFFTAHGLQRMR